jgi:hypothetical protein
MKVLLRLAVSASIIFCLVFIAFGVKVSRSATPTATGGAVKNAFGNKLEPINNHIPSIDLLRAWANPRSFQEAGSTGERPEVQATPVPTWSNASLQGTYAYQLTEIEEVHWQNTVSCWSYGEEFTWTGYGQSAITVVSNGLLTADGHGNIAGSQTQRNMFDQAGSDNTVTITCVSPTQQVTNSGRVVYLPPETSTIKGTYSTEPNGTGTFSGGANFQLAGSNANGLATIVFFATPDQEHPITGILVHE